MAPESPADRAPVSAAGVLAAVRIDLERLHAAWMDVAFPGQREPVHPVRGRWQPESVPERIAYAVWGVLGLAALLVAYPSAVVGFGVRAYARWLRHVVVAVGLLGVVVGTGALWSVLTAVAYLREFPAVGLVAVASGGTVATVAAVLAVVSARTGGRATTLALAYPFAVTAVFLPPVVAAFYAPALAAVVFPGSQQVAIWLLDGLLAVVGLATFFRTNFVLAGVGYVGLWFGLSFPVGWLLGLFVGLANLARPPDDVATT